MKQILIAEDDHCMNALSWPAGRSSFRKIIFMRKKCALGGKGVLEKLLYKMMLD